MVFAPTAKAVRRTKLWLSFYKGCVFMMVVDVSLSCTPGEWVVGCSCARSEAPQAHVLVLPSGCQEQGWGVTGRGSDDVDRLDPVLCRDTCW